MKTFNKINLVFMLCFLLFTPTLANASMTSHFKIHAHGAPYEIRWHGTWYESQEIEVSLSSIGVINPSRSSGMFKIHLSYAEEDIYLRATGRIIEIYHEITQDNLERWVINGEGLVIKDSYQGKYQAIFQIRVYPIIELISLDIFDNGEHLQTLGEVYINAIPFSDVSIVEGEQEDKLIEKYEKIEEKYTEKQGKIEEKLDEKQGKLDEKTSEKQDKVSEKYEEKLEKLEEKYLEDLEKQNDKKDKLEEKYEEKLQKLQEKFNKKQEKIEEKYAKKLQKLQEKYNKKLEKLLE